jgi:hypothetical protein
LDRVEFSPKVCATLLNVLTSTVNNLGQHHDQSIHLVGVDGTDVNIFDEFSEFLDPKNTAQKMAEMALDHMRAVCMAVWTQKGEWWVKDAVLRFGVWSDLTRFIAQTPLDDESMADYENKWKSIVIKQDDIDALQSSVPLDADVFKMLNF